jgi:gluconolactonase
MSVTYGGRSLKGVSILSFLVLLGTVAAEEYRVGPDSQRKPNVPRGTVTHYTWKSTIFPGTERDYWVYVPSQYNAAQKACLMVFQDGGGYVKEEGSWRVPVVFDNLIASGEMPVTIGVFVDPGVNRAWSDAQQPRFNRAFEYDSLGTRYARFLLEEILPEVGKQYNLSSDPNDRAISGSSSGGIAAFTVAFNRPDSFRRVLCFIGSFANLRGGDIYPALIRKMEPLPLRVFLQDGSNDLNLYAGNWFLANQEIASSLDLAGYESKFVTGTEGHNGKHGSAILPDALRWLWKGYPQPISRSKEAHGGTPTVERHFITQILDPESDWEQLSSGHVQARGLAVDRNGDVFFADVPKSRIYRIDSEGKVTVYRNDTGHADGLMFGPDRRLYAAQSANKRIVVFNPDGPEAVVAENAPTRDIAVTSRGGLYFTDPAGHKIWFIDPRGERRVVYEGSDIRQPAGIAMSPDEAFVMVADSAHRSVWSFQVQADASLANGEPFYHLELPDDVLMGPLRTDAEGVAEDTEEFLYTATNLGIQISDPASKTVGIIRKPAGDNPTSLVFGGKDLHTLYVIAGDKVFRRRLRRQGSFPWQPIKLTKPEL